jgi:error-prone DNA polymerase
MPQNEFPKLVPHPFRDRRAGEHGPGPSQGAQAGNAAGFAYAELCVTSNYTFLRGGSHPEELVRRAGELGHRAIAITDVHSLAGVVRAHVAAKEAGIELVVGARCAARDVPGAWMCLYAASREGYARLCRLLTTGKRRAPKGQCWLDWAEIIAAGRECGRGLLAMIGLEASRGWRDADVGDLLSRAREGFDDDRLSLAVTRRYAGGKGGWGGGGGAGAGGEWAQRLAKIGEAIGVAAAATNDVLYHDASRRMLQDVLTCIRHGCTLEQAGSQRESELEANAERRLKDAEEMSRLFADMPAAIARSTAIADRCAGFSMDQLRYEYPDEIVPEGTTAQQHLEALTWRGAAERYPRDRHPEGVPPKVRAQIEHELALIRELNYAAYFLTVEDLVRFARSRSPAILCQGRGAAANSAVCYCLGVTAVDPDRISVLFERFISKERNEPPDIDIDFEHERREEVIQYIYRKYGRERAALTAEVITYRRRSAIRDVGKALGLSLDLVDRLAKDGDWWDQGTVRPEQLRAMGLNPGEPTLAWLARLVGEILGFPRHLSQHVGGFIITRGPLCEIVPVENAAMPDRTVIEWDKDDVDAMGMMKVDVLGLGMLTAIRRCLGMVNERRGKIDFSTETERCGEGGEDIKEGADESINSSLLPPTLCVSVLKSSLQHLPLALHTIPPEDPATYAMIQRADTIGVFQIESRAQMSMLPRLKPRCFYDLVIEVAIVRPGPIQGDMVHPYLRRRNGEEPVTYPNDAVREVLGRTLGVPLFQEQAMQLAIVAAGFTGGEADQLRRAMAAWKRKGDLIYRFGSKLIAGMIERGYPEAFAHRCFEQIKGFSEYGFPESHAASFALLVYASCWLKRHHPAQFAAAVINSQPMGFYAPAQLIRDAREHGVEVLPVDVRHSSWDCTTPLARTIRLGMRLVRGLSRTDADKIAAASHARAKSSMVDLWRASGASAAAFVRLARADAFGSMDLSRQQALWHAKLLRDERLPLFDGIDDGSDQHQPELPAIAPARQVAEDYTSVGLSLKRHPVSFVRERIARAGACPCAALLDPARTPDGECIRVGGLVLVRQRPGTASGVVFITLEDETGIANLILWSRTFEKHRKAARLSRALLVRGRVQREGEVVHVLVHGVRSLDPWMDDLVVRSRDFH